MYIVDIKRLQKTKQKINSRSFFGQLTALCVYDSSCVKLDKATNSYLGMLLNGIKLGLTHGFDTGVSLDYIY